ncbi:GNAT family N-acetyltransferase [Lysinibacillus sp. KCTC 33748]|uniref:GNAT family N-acetyltransferase n=1 Tax=unclassified Lysinibacillus TaxID=2636778 RepID=UPI0009A57765|nr:MULTISPECIES: GNAT family N-acetyltransferase [unclassified Lysinibacillus]OXS74988.1 GNAT family N-acetyltransferase [Lysinibacillus sp. KCTC 33748]SKB61374.1 Protein N-acetyltransferase, RimJ/RimL family [Lysinibacillus sp. AC-3]
MGYVHEKLLITTERLVLRLFETTDAETVAKLCNNYNIYKSTMYLPYPYSLDDALSWMEHHYDNFTQDISYEFAVTDKETGELYGAIALSNNKRLKQGEIAYWIGEEYWGKGYATEAAQSIVQFAFEEKRLHKVFARYFSTNPASGTVMDKIGMKQEGILKDHIIKDGKYEDLVFYGIINE